MRISLLITTAVAALVLTSALTRRAKDETAFAAQQEQTTGSEYRSRSGHFVLQYPSEWSAKPTKEYTLLLETESAGDAALVTVDVPYIPPHFPGMMTMKLVVNGYLDDLAKRLTDLRVVERNADRLDGAAAQKLVVTGRERAGDRQGEQRTIVGLVAIRNEQVYIVQADATPESLEVARDGMASVAGNWHWTR